MLSRGRILSKSSTQHLVCAIVTISVTPFRCDGSSRNSVSVELRPQSLRHRQERSFVSANGDCKITSAAVRSATERCYNPWTSPSMIRARGYFPPSPTVFPKTYRRHIRTGTVTMTSRFSDSSKPTVSPAAKRQPALDPTAKRTSPSARQKCDPYGLGGGSLSYAACLEPLSTLEEGWTLIRPAEDMTMSKGDTTRSKYVESAEGMRPVFLQKQYYHPTFQEASRFLSHLSLLATNLNHFPFLSMERVLVDDVNKDARSPFRNEKSCDRTATMARQNRKTKHRRVGWVFRSTVRCSTYRPSAQCQDNSNGLTYHDFHLAMSIDVEANREELKRSLW